MKAMMTIIALVAISAVVTGCDQLQSAGLTRPKVTTGSIRVEATIDGTDTLWIQGNSLWITHDRFDLPSKLKINGIAWNPRWMSNQTDKFTAIQPAFSPKKPDDVKLAPIRGRGLVVIADKPHRDNQYTVLVTVDDPANGPDDYEFVISW